MPASSDNFTLLLGASGILGRELARQAGAANALATHMGRPHSGSVFFDARSMDVASLWAGRAPPAHAIVMLGITNIDACASDPEGCARTNVDASVRVIDALLAHSVTPVFVSSDGVFDGSRAWWSEDDAVSPVLDYGRQKLAVERHLAATGRGLTVRLPKLLEDGHARVGLLPGWIDALERSDRILCATDQFFTPASARDAAAAILGLARQGARGLVHVAGPERLSRRDLLDTVLEEYSRFAAPRAAITDCLLGELPVLQRRPLDTSMRTARLQENFGLRLRDARSVARESVRQRLQPETQIP